MNPAEALQMLVNMKTELTRSGAYHKEIDQILNRKILEALKQIKISTKRGE